MLSARFSFLKKTILTPKAPTEVAGVSGNAQISLSWSAPSDNGGSAITDYVVQYSSDGGATWITFSDGVSTTTSATVTGLTNGTSYVFRVAAVNFDGIGSYSTQTGAITPISVGYAYNVMNLNYIGSINNSIYGLYYDT